MDDGTREKLGSPYRLLENARAYDGLQRVVGARRAQRWLVEVGIEPKPGMAVLDVGAGTGSLFDVLPGVEYSAIEPNEHYVDQMQARIGDQAKQILRGTSDDLDGVLGDFDRILVIALLHHLDDAAATRLLRAASARLRPQGRVVLFDPCFHARQSRVARLLVGMDRGDNVREVGQYVKIACQSFPRVRHSVVDGLLRIPYSHSLVICEP